MVFEENECFDSGKLKSILNLLRYNILLLIEFHIVAIDIFHFSGSDIFVSRHRSLGQCPRAPTPESESQWRADEKITNYFTFNPNNERTRGQVRLVIIAIYMTHLMIDHHLIFMNY